jgi:hypothetical protein
MSEPVPNPYSPPKAPVVQEPEPVAEPSLARDGPEGLGGWLVIVAISLVVSPIRLVLFIVQTYLPLVRDGTFLALITPASERFHPMLASIIVLEVIVNAFFIAFSIWLIVLFFQKSRRFPLRFVILSVLSVVFILGDTLAVAALDLGSPWDAEGIRELMRGLFALCVWGPYMFVSARVNNTFVRR